MNKRWMMFERRDWGFVAIIGVVGLVSVWLLLMPFVPAIAKCTMHRFHLRSSSFGWWAVQQPIPSMYNFCNRVEVRNLPPAEAMDGLIDPVLLDPIGTSSNSPGLSQSSPQGAEDPPIGQLMNLTLNHFPSRIFTFGDSRGLWTEPGEPRWFVLRSSYRSQVLESVYFLDRTEDGAWLVTLEQSRAPER